jgi:hypothetical protein
MKAQDDDYYSNFCFLPNRIQNNSPHFITKQINNLKDTQALPIELTSFEANFVNKTIELNRQTATAGNYYWFQDVDN